ncbi:hypothetical protein A3L04_04460 [Thermococcus chitonophagus]|uniref:Uncharacterized protein n=1 Tax=Thermococcus chitonophagus TaxID=54262 RepID=A0A160VX86_9EURY|nr:hypothetical protein [Thermococcus chitonophagus]ASJ16377.1 hypothetical protein A3L04_04460 [Thermococcus chitonophagus]CUX78631.1 hypothetical protein CHITON_1852 [Thermococcus chitonophagus]
MKKALIAIISLIFAGLIISAVVDTYRKVLPQNLPITGSNMPTMTSIQSHNYTIIMEETDNGLNLTRGVYNVSGIDESLRKKLLDPTEWYVTNTTLSYEYAEEMYNETLEIVKNSTEQSKSIIYRFLEIFPNTERIKEKVDEIMNKLENLTKR